MAENWERRWWVYPCLFFEMRGFSLFKGKMKLGGCVSKTFKGGQLIYIQDFASIP